MDLLSYSKFSRLTRPSAATTFANSPYSYKFTGKERDTESGLDYFIARYYSSAYGRFLSPDEFTGGRFLRQGGPVDAYSSNDPLPPDPLPYADITNPQSLNRLISCGKFSASQTHPAKLAHRI